jgi:uncharacterized protein YgiM (DUF1202 family)
MAGRPRKNNFIKDIEEEKNAVEEVFETKEIESKPEPVEVKEVKNEEPKSRVRTATVKADPWLNVRSRPSFDSDCIDKLYSGDEVTIYEEKNGFGKIAILDDRWVSLKFIF